MLAVKNLSSLISAKVAQKLSLVILKRFEGKEGVAAEWSKAMLSGAKENGKMKVLGSPPGTCKTWKRYCNGLPLDE